MGYELDAEFATAVAPLLKAIANAPKVPVGDVLTRRGAIDAMMASFASRRPPVSDVTTSFHEVLADDASALELRWYAKSGSEPGSAVLYLHGGGMICGTLDIYDSVVRQLVSSTGVPMLAVGYRLAPEFPHPVPVEDCFAALRWLVGNAGALGVDPARIAVMGDSAGGGLAAGVALMARDRGVGLARQVLVYPMLDDRTRPEAVLMPFLTWTYDDNATGWGALLGDSCSGDAVSPYAAPARAADLSGLAPAYIEVGELDAFRNEDIEYARRLGLAGVSIELRVHPGVPHAFDALAPRTDVARRAVADRVRVLGAL